MFLVARWFNDDTEDPILDYIRVIEFDTLLFFLGILLLVSMLKEIGVLNHFLGLYQVLPPAAANYFMGILSAGIDNVPLTAALLKSGITMSTGEWLSLTFGQYLRFCGPLLVAYSIGYAAAWAMGV